VSSLAVEVTPQTRIFMFIIQWHLNDAPRPGSSTKYQVAIGNLNWDNYGHTTYPNPLPVTWNWHKK
jgi:hypothetical protein